MSKLEEVEALVREELGVKPVVNDRIIDEPLPVENENERELEGEIETEPASTDTSTDTSHTVRDIAEKLGIEAREVYEKLIIPMSDGTTITLGELKDLAGSGKVEREAYENSNTEIMTQVKNLTMLAEMLTPQQAEQAKYAIEAHAQRETALLAKALPTWKDASIAEREEKSIMDLTGKYGLSKSETEALVTDHRLVKLLRDIAVRGGVNATSSTPKAAARQHQKSDDSYKRAQMPDATKSDKLSAISALII